MPDSHGRNGRPILAFALLGLALGTLPERAHGQTLEEVRDALRDLAESERYSMIILGFADLAEDRTLSGSSFTQDADPDLDVRALRFPFSFDPTTIGDEPAAEGAPPRAETWIVEGTVAGVEGRVDFPDIWSGSLPGLETRVESRFRAVSLLVGIGRRVEISPTTRITPFLDLAIAHVRNDANESGPGEAVTETVLEGILFDWEATLGQVGLGLELEDRRSLSPRLDLESTLRADVRYSTDLSTTDRAQELEETDLVVGARTDLLIETGVRVADVPVALRLFTGGVLFTGRTADALGFPILAEVGVGVESAVPEGVPVVSAVDLRFSTLWGEHIRGFSVGFGVKF